MSNAFAHVLDQGKENEAATAPISLSARAGKRKSLADSPASQSNTVNLAPTSEKKRKSLGRRVSFSSTVDVRHFWKGERQATSDWHHDETVPDSQAPPPVANVDDDDLNEFNQLLASADNVEFDVTADETMDLTTAVGAVVRNIVAAADDDSMQLTAVVATSTASSDDAVAATTSTPKPSLFAMVEQMRDDALYDAETDSESENTFSLANATVAVDDNQTRDMDETAAVGETRIVVKLQPTILSDAVAADATMDMTAVVGRGIVNHEEAEEENEAGDDARADATMDLTAVVPQRMRVSETPVRSNGLAALLHQQQRDDGDTTRAIGDAAAAAQDDATGNVPPSLGDLLKLYQRTDSTQRLSLCAELCDAVGVDARECDRDMMQVMESLGDAETDVVAVGDETAALVNTGRFGNTTRVVAGGLAAGDVTSGFTTILGRLRELREHYDGITQDITTANNTSVVPVGAATMALADATFEDDVVIRAAIVAPQAPVPQAIDTNMSVTTTNTIAITTNITNDLLLVGANEDDELASAQENDTVQSIDALLDEEEEEEPPVEEEPTEAIVSESAALSELKALAVERGWRLVVAAGVAQYNLVRASGVFRTTVNASVIDGGDAAEMGSVSVRATTSGDSDAKVVCDALQWRMSTSLTGRDFGTRFVHVCDAVGAAELLFDDIRAARRRFNVSVTGGERETVQVVLRLSNVAVRQQWRVLLTVKNVCAYPRTGVTASAELLIGDAAADSKGAALVKLVAKNSKKNLRLVDIITQSNQMLWQ